MAAAKPVHSPEPKAPTKAVIKDTAKVMDEPEVPMTQADFEAKLASMQAELDEARANPVNPIPTQGTPQLITKLADGTVKTDY